MIKKIFLFTLVMFPVLSFAQEAKIAYVNYGEVILAMPEYKQMVDSLEKRGQMYQTEMQTINDEYSKKYSDYLSVQDSLDESIKIRRVQEIENIRVSAENFQQFAQQNMEELQNALIGPVTNKLQKAINEVGAENNYLYIANSQSFLYISPNATDATPLVRKKLGIQ